jgi:ribonuclease D
VIDTEHALAELVSVLRQAPWVAMDTEADSLHAYPEKLCLIQLALPGQDELIDPLAALDLGPLWKALAHQELIMHGADYDLRLLRRCAGFLPSRLFDTMLAARLLGYKRFGLTDLVAHHFGVHWEKGPQKANWARRPLTPRMAAYARNDVHYLKPLADLLRSQLAEKHRLAWHQECCARLIQEAADVRAPDPSTVWRVKGSHKLGPKGLAVLREIWQWREAEAVAANKPPFFVLPTDTMVQLAQAAEQSNAVTEAQLPSHLSPRRRQGLLHAIEKGRTTPHLPEVLRTKGWRLTDAQRQRLHELTQRRDRQATRLGIDPTLIASRALLVLLARDWDAHQGQLMSWQRALLTGSD